MEKVQIKKESSAWFCPNIFIGNKEITNVKNATFHVGADDVPTFDLEVVGVPDIDVMADVTIDPSPTNLQEACRIITHELLKHGEFYSAFVGSVASVLKPRERYVGDGCFCIDIDDDTDHKGLAEEIVKRISGEE